MPRKPASSPTGSSSGAMPAPKRSWSALRVRSKLARSRSSLLMNTSRGRPSSAARFHAASVWASMPSTALTTTTARSTTEQRGPDLAEEVGVAGGVDDVDLDVAEHARGHGERQRHVALDLFGLEVAHGGAVVDLALPGDGAGGEEQRLGQSGLARAVVSDQGDVADAGRWVTRHPAHLPPSRSFRRATACDRCGCEPIGDGCAQPGRGPSPGSRAEGRGHRGRPRRADGTTGRWKPHGGNSRMFDGRWRHAVDRTTKPVGTALVRAGITADVLTIFGLVMSVVTAFAVGSGHLVAGIFLLFPTGLPDLFDGPVAKASGRASVRGAFFDSVADRISDAFLFGGVAWYLAARHHGEMVLLPFAILAVTSLISYQRAKAELLGLSAKGGLMERAERFILLGLVLHRRGRLRRRRFVPALWVFFGLLCATAVGPVRQRLERGRRAASAACRPGPCSPSADMDVTRRALARWREGRVGLALADLARGPRPSRRRSGAHAAVPRRAAQPLGSVAGPSRRRAVEPSGRIWRARREARPAARSGRRPASRGF